MFSGILIVYSISLAFLAVTYTVTKKNAHDTAITHKLNKYSNLFYILDDMLKSINRLLYFILAPIVALGVMQYLFTQK